MEELFIPFETGIPELLKQRGFSSPCFAYYSYIEGNPLRISQCDTYLGIESCFKAPLYQQVIEWFRSVHKIKIDIHHTASNGTETYTIWKWNFDNNIGKWERISPIGSFEKWSDAANKAIIEAIKLLP